jgi:hypothetical protein
MYSASPTFYFIFNSGANSECDTIDAMTSGSEPLLVTEVLPTL